MKISLPRLSIFATFILLFMLIGYIQASWLGMVAGLIIPLVSFALLPVSLVPFVGFPLYILINSYFLDNILSYIPIFDLAVKMNMVFGFLSCLICVGTSILTVLLATVIIKMGRLELKFKKIANIKCFQLPELQNVTLPSFKAVITGKADLNGIIDQIIDIVFEIWEKLNKQLVGSVIFWFGVGIASHDFWWENEEAQVNVARPTHGTYLGLEIASAGMHVIVWDMSLKDKIKKCLLFYIGMASCFVGFVLTGIIPKGITRIICHAFWWSGVVLMAYNWFNLVKEKLL